MGSVIQAFHIIKIHLHRQNRSVDYLGMNLLSAQ